MADAIRFSDSPFSTIDRERMRRINFLVIGAQKAGTTWLHRALKEHEDAFLPDQKEIHFFNANANFAKGADWYLSFFRGSEQKTAVGEVTPNYIWSHVSEFESQFNHVVSRQVAPRVRDALPHVKLLISLRNPVDRAISAYYHFVTRGDFSPFQRLRDCMHMKGVASMGRYDKQLESWFAVFPKDQIKVLVYEDDIRPDEAKMETVNRVYRFLGLEEKDHLPGLFDRQNAQQAHVLAYLRQIPGLRGPRNAVWTGRPPLGERIALALNRRIPPRIQTLFKVRVEQADRDALAEHYAPHQARIENMLGRALPW